MALDARQRALYTHTVDIWRGSQAIAEDGAVSESALSRVAQGVPCYLKIGPSTSIPVQGMGRAEEDMIFTLDQVHLDQETDVEEADYLHNLTPGPAYDEWWLVRGGVQRISPRPPIHTGKVMVYAVHLEEAPEGVS